ncbi:MAG: hypothetical protein CL811_11345 [Colwelliaceae bacterium]|nr:hypothetical protein [Colwelliaceae bacterium]
MINFQSHGNADITVDDNIIFVEATGPWNKEYFEGFHQELLAASAHLKPGKFGVHLTVKGEAIASPESIEAHIEFLKHSTVSGIAVNFAQCTTTHISKLMFTDVYQRAGNTFSIFDDPKSGCDWLQSVIAD